MEHNQITKEWIDQQRAVSDAANERLYSEASENAKSTIICSAFDAALDALEAAYAEIARLTAERDAAIMDAAYGKCATCKRSHDNCYPDDDCDVCDDYQWRGLCAENAPEGGNGDG